MEIKSALINNQWLICVLSHHQCQHLHRGVVAFTRLPSQAAWSAQSPLALGKTKTLLRKCSKYRLVTFPRCVCVHREPRRGHKLRLVGRILPEATSTLSRTSFFPMLWVWFEMCTGRTWNWVSQRHTYEDLWLDTCVAWNFFGSPSHYMYCVCYRHGLQEQAAWPGGDLVIPERPYS